MAAVAAGNALEFYDFLIYSTFAIYIGAAYFPVHSPVASLLLSLATFGIGFVTRPIGSIVLGRLGDRVGRKPAMLISFGLMAVGLMAIAATPAYVRIGPAAPIIVVLARLIQGFALGGELGPSTAFLIESAPRHRRGLIGAMQSASQAVAALSAATVALGLSLLLSRHDLAAWGWRLAFLVGLLIVPFGLVVRRSLAETAPHLRPSPPPASAPAAFPWHLVLVSTALLASGTIQTYVGLYMTTYAMDTLRLPPHTAFGVGVVGGICGLVFAPLGGLLSDRLGRRAVMIPAACLCAALTLPAYGLVIARPTALTLYAAVAAIAVPGALAGGPLLVAITESFPPAMRCLAVGTIYAVAIMLFGGTTQFIVAALVHITHQPMAPAYYRLAAAIVGIAAMACLPESAPAKLDLRAFRPAVTVA